MLYHMNKNVCAFKKVVVWNSQFYEIHFLSLFTFWDNLSVTSWKAVKEQ